MSVKVPRKLIEVALPLDDINHEAAREKSLRHGHPSTLHLWWARRPLAAARAALFAQLVNAPDTEAEREELFAIIRELVKWENIDDQALLARAKKAIMASWQKTCEANKNHPEAKKLFNPKQLPAFHDPFAGGGAIPLEAKRLGLNAYASDLNPVAVLINKAMLEIPAQFNATLAQDIKKYGELLRERAFKKIGKLYPPVEITAAMVRQRPELKKYRGKQLTVVAYLWARTVKSPDPACSEIDVPLISSYVLSAKKGKEAYLKPIVKGKNYRFAIMHGEIPDWAKSGTKTGRGNFQCLVSGAAINSQEIRQQGKAGKMGAVLMAVVLEGEREKVYLASDAHDVTEQRLEKKFNKLIDKWKPQQRLVGKSAMNVSLYGLTHYGNLFTTRQLIALATFCESLFELCDELHKEKSKAYANAISIYLALVISKCTDYWSSICPWDNTTQTVRHTFVRQAIPMIWSYAEAQPFSMSSGSWDGMLNWLCKVVATFTKNSKGTALQLDAVQQKISKNKIIATDPPYYDNIGYADLSDFFYVWLRPLLKDTYPDLFRTMIAPKDEELISAPHRHNNDKQQANDFFKEGISKAVENFRINAHPAFPVVIYYAFKQTEGNGWETFLDAVIKAGFIISGTWPMRTEMKARMLAIGSNALASSIILVCKQRAEKKNISKRAWKRELRKKLPAAVRKMTIGDNPIDAVDLAQAVLGPGMEIFSQYEAVLSQSGEKMTVREALRLINQELLNAENFDNDTAFCIKWFEQHGWQEGDYGEAETLAKAKGVSVEGVSNAGVLSAKRGKVRLLRCNEYPDKWSPEQDERLPAWEAAHHLIKTINNKGEAKAGHLLKQLPAKEDEIKQLGYHLYQVCDQKKWSEDAGDYNMLIQAWPELKKVA
ncbi:MAG: DUF1156 domain-containing protein [Pseudomonadota bacterium]|nr:DUF1156 domain-containing protein [Pseudomonadota bacterium]